MTISAASRRSWTRLALYLATAAITVGFSYLALHGIDYHEAWSGLRASDWWWLVPALVAFGLGNVARALRWRSLFSPARRPPRSTTANAMMIGYLYNSILPSRAGEAARVLALNQRSDSAGVEITSTVVLERVYDVVAILLIFLIAQPWLPHVSWLGTAALVMAALAVLVLVAVTVLALYEDRPVSALLRPLGRFSVFSGERLERTVAEIGHGLAGLRNHRVALEALAWTTLAWLMSIVCAYLVGHALHMSLPFSSGVLVTVAIGAGMILPSAPAAVGVFEGATLIALHAYGVGRSTALPYALVLHLVNLVPFLLVGASILFYNSRHPPAHFQQIERRAPHAAAEPKPPVPLDVVSAIE